MPLKLLKGIQNFKLHQFKNNRDTFAALSQGQTPGVLFITCSDSRIVPTLFTGAGIGELFVIRNAGNIIPPYASFPSGEAATIEFALEHLGVKEIVICGHSHCGAMKGLLHSDLKNELPTVAHWLEYAKPALEHIAGHEGQSSTKLLTLLACQNILQQMKHLETHPSVAKRLKDGSLKIHGWYYEFENGEISIYNPEQKTFFSFEETVELIAQEKLAYCVKKEALHYLNSLIPIKKTQDFTLLEQFIHLNQVSSIWDKIKLKVGLELLNELGEFYLDANKKITDKFEKLLEAAPLIEVCIDESMRKALEDMSFSSRVSTSQNIHFFRPSMSSTETRELCTNTKNL